MITRENFNTTKVARVNGVFPQAVSAGQYLFLSGMPGIDPVLGTVISENFEDQLRQSFLNIKTVLEEAGSGMNKVIKTTIFMVAGNDFSTVDKLYGAFFTENPPARSVPQVMPFPAGILVSVECIAVL